LKFIDLTGQKFGRLTVIEKASIKNKQILWKCLCDCGNEKIVLGNSLKKGLTKSCGCIGKEGKFQNLIGQVFGRLTVISLEKRIKKGKHYQHYWLCKCECGNDKIVESHSLLYDNTKSCGCLMKERVRESNFINLTGQRFGRLLVINEVPTPDNVKTKRTHWKCICDCGNELIVNASSLRNGNTQSCGCLQSEICKRGLSSGESALNGLFATYKIGAKKRNLIFNLTKKEFIYFTQQNCFYCNTEPKQIKKNKWDNGNYVYNGIDRIDNTRGYTLDNCVTSCGQCNQAKMDMSYNNFLIWIKNVYNNLFLMEVI